jgi:hypothetical protein
MKYLIGLVLYVLGTCHNPELAEPVETTEQRCPQYEPVFALYDMPVDKFSYIAWRESRCQPDAYNGDDPNKGSFGLLQINSIHWKDMETRPHLWGDVKTACQTYHHTDGLNAIKNICVASYLYRKSGLYPWGYRDDSPGNDSPVSNQ